MSTPILNPPQSAILGMHKIQDRPMAIGGKVEIRPMMYLALSYDHRVVDGKEAVSFLVRVKEGVEDPAPPAAGPVSPLPAKGPLPPGEGWVRGRPPHFSAPIPRATLTPALSGGRGSRRRAGVHA